MEMINYNKDLHSQKVADWNLVKLGDYYYIFYKDGIKLKVSQAFYGVDNIIEEMDIDLRPVEIKIEDTDVIWIKTGDGIEHEYKAGILMWSKFHDGAEHRYNERGIMTWKKLSNGVEFRYADNNITWQKLADGREFVYNHG